jgi:adenylate cyclase
VVSDEVCAMAGIAADALPRSQVSIRGREEPMVVRAVADPTVLLRLLETQAAA